MLLLLLTLLLFAYLRFKDYLFSTTQEFEEDETIADEDEEEEGEEEEVVEEETNRRKGDIREKDRKRKDLKGGKSNANRDASLARGRNRFSIRFFPCT